jgi:tetratricopeptide (TPR) repeat protein
MRPLRKVAITAAVAVIVLAVALFVRSNQRDPAPRQAVSTERSPEAAVARAEQRLAQDPDDADALALLAVSSLGVAKNSADSSWYRRSDEAAARALDLDPENVVALESKATLANARHRFADAIEPARASLQLAPDRFVALEILTDANIELGRYEEGFALAERRLALRPDLSSYTRASYAAELRGDRDLATRLMTLAVDSGRPGSGDRVFAQVHLGLLRLGSGDLPGALRAMRRARAEAPGDSAAAAGLAKVEAARGRLDLAAALYREALASGPTSPVASDLAEVELARGRKGASDAALDLARELDRRETRNGVVLELDAAAVEANFRRPTDAEVAAARRGHAARPGVVGDDSLGWVLTRSGRCDEGLRYARRSLRLGTNDALMLFHAGMAARCAGQSSEAVTYLRRALGLNPRFSVRWAPVAARALRQLTAV